MLIPDSLWQQSIKTFQIQRFLWICDMLCVQTNSPSEEEVIALIDSHHPLLQAAKKQKVERFGCMT